MYAAAITGMRIGQEAETKALGGFAIVSEGSRQSRVAAKAEEGRGAVAVAELEGGIGCALTWFPGAPLWDSRRVQVARRGRTEYCVY